MFEIPIEYANLTALAGVMGRLVMTTDGKVHTNTYAIHDTKVKDFVIAARKLSKK